jgi:uncharacterized protein YqeY
MIKDKINTDYLTAFREKNTVVKNLLSVVKGEIQTVEKNTNVSNLSDEDVVKILNKILKSLKETQTKFPSEQNTKELLTIESYLPKQMSVEEIEEKVFKSIEAGASNIGEIMKLFSNLPVDRKLVSEVYMKVKK